VNRTSRGLTTWSGPRPTAPPGRARSRSRTCRRPPRPKPSSKNQERRARRLEIEIERAEARLATIERELADPQAWNDPRSAARSMKKHAAVKARVEALYAELETVGG
jgi:ATP-binding cassette subfamily F protein 3